MSRFRSLLIGLLGAMLLLPGCGDGDLARLVTGVLHVSRGGSGAVFLPGSQRSYPFADSVTVAVRSSHDGPNQFAVYTFFGLSRLNLNEVPDAALVTFVDGLSPAASSSTEAPSSVFTMAFHDGFGQAARAILAQDATQIFERTSAGTLVLEPQPRTDGGFSDQNSDQRRIRWATMTLVDLQNGETALVEGAADYQLSQDISQNFFSYAGNLGLTTPPGNQGGGPPPPPGSTGGGGGGSTGGGDDSPPSPPL